MRILLLTTTHNGLCQHAHAELVERGHTVSLKLIRSTEEMEEAAAFFKPQLIIVPFLSRSVPATILQAYNVLTLNIASGSDRSPVYHDGTMINNWQSWSITVMQAGKEIEEGSIRASHTFKMHSDCKKSFVRHHVAQAAVQDILKAVDKFERKAILPKTIPASFPLNRVRMHGIRL